jgi:uncharacterized membrane protein YdjX (TVP38/TMEM64 family)
LYNARGALLIGIIGNAIGITGAFFVGRWRGVCVVTRIVGKKHIQEVLHLVHHLQDMKKFTLTRIVLFPLEDFINYAAGMSHISFLHFFGISLLITTLGSVIPIWLGHILI